MRRCVGRILEKFMRIDAAGDNRSRADPEHTAERNAHPFGIRRKNDVALGLQRASGIVRLIVSAGNVARLESIDGSRDALAEHFNEAVAGGSCPER